MVGSFIIAIKKLSHEYEETMSVSELSNSIESHHYRNCGTRHYIKITNSGGASVCNERDLDARS